MSPTRDQSLSALHNAAPPAAIQWLASKLRDPALDSDLALRLAYAQVARQFAAPSQNSPAWADHPRWNLVDIARLHLLLTALDHRTPPSHVELVASLMRTGELGEQVSLLRALPHLPAPARFTEIAIEAARTNATEVFAALACDNPYPCAHFPAPALRQLVLKVLFVGLPLARVDGLTPRIDAQLVRMVEDFASERRAAGRDVPADAGLILDHGGELR